MKLPTVHLNGSSPKRLFEAYAEAAGAIRRAMEAVSAAAPNGRDYYPQGPAAIGEAVQEHTTRVLALECVMRDMQMLAEHVQDNAGPRGVS